VKHHNVFVVSAHYEVNSSSNNNSHRHNHRSDKYLLPLTVAVTSTSTLTVSMMMMAAIIKIRTMYPAVTVMHHVHRMEVTEHSSKVF